MCLELVSLKQFSPYCFLAQWKMKECLHRSHHTAFFPSPSRKGVYTAWQKKPAHPKELLANQPCQSLCEPKTVVNSPQCLHHSVWAVNVPGDASSGWAPPGSGTPCTEGAGPKWTGIWWLSPTECKHSLCQDWDISPQSHNRQQEPKDEYRQSLIFGSVTKWLEIHKERKTKKWQHGIKRI